MGFPIGASDSPKNFLLEVHYDNRLGIEGVWLFRFYLPHKKKQQHRISDKKALGKTIICGFLLITMADSLQVDFTLRFVRIRGSLCNEP